MTGLKHHTARSSTGTAIVVVLVLAVFALFAVAVFAAPKKVPTAKPGDCTACHGTDKVFSSPHADTKQMTLKDCLGCHEKTGPQKLEGRLPGSHLHNLRGITCAKCHGTEKKAEEVEMQRCLTCHNADKLAEKTAKVKPENPHTSPHWGTSLDCNLCHHQHKKSENYCAQCHTFDFKVP